jgi:FKBP-type peptidyl-prolyl cis-trans isomerase 2
MQAQGGEWKKELLFAVPRDHEEIQRLEGRYRSQGGVQEGLVVELSNGGMAVVVKCGEDAVVLDANSMLAGKMLTFELELILLERS